MLARKVHMPMGDDLNHRGSNSRRWIIAEAENSLRRLGTDWVDLYQIHHYDPERLRSEQPPYSMLTGAIESDQFHPVGTCKMGTDDRAAADPQRRVHGVEGPGRAALRRWKPDDAR